MKYFSNVKTLDELKRAYRLLCMKHHPDVGGDTATMQAINAEHDELFEQLKRAHNATTRPPRRQRSSGTSSRRCSVWTAWRWSCAAPGSGSAATPGSTKRR